MRTTRFGRNHRTCPILRIHLLRCKFNPNGYSGLETTSKKSSERIMQIHWLTSLVFGIWATRKRGLVVVKEFSWMTWLTLCVCPCVSRSASVCASLLKIKACSTNGLRLLSTNTFLPSAPGCRKKFEQSSLIKILGFLQRNDLFRPPVCSFTRVIVSSATTQLQVLFGQRQTFQISDTFEKESWTSFKK